MSPRVLLRLGLRNLLLHKLRSTLSALGIVLGVGAVVAMSSVGEGARREAIAQVEALGIDAITVRARPPLPGDREEPLALRDAESLANVVPRIAGVAPVREAAMVAEAAGRRADVTGVGTTPAYHRTSRLALAAGRFLTDVDLREGKRVAVLGATAARQLFPLGEPLGSDLRLGSDWFVVVGVLEGRASPRSRGGPIRARDVNRAVFVPLPALDHGPDSRPDGIDEVVLRVDDPGEVVASADAVKNALKRRGHAAVDVIVPREILRQRERTQRIFDVVTGVIAAISLLVGGIGIMNIMLASVAERTAEVGIRRAVGATRRDVAAQFLTESALLTASGGAAGAALGIAGSFLIQRWAAWPTALSPVMLVASLVMAVAVGVGFGFYPAWRAAHLEPMEALRHE